MSTLDSNLKSDKCILSLASKYILITQVKRFSKKNTCAFLHRLSKHWTYMLSKSFRQANIWDLAPCFHWSKLARLKCVLSLFVIDEYLSFTVIYCFMFQPLSRHLVFLSVVVVSPSLHSSLVSLCGERESFVLSFCCEFLLICHLLFDFMVIFVNFHLFVVIWLFFGPIGFCLQSLCRLFSTPCVWFLLSSLGCGFSLSSRFSLVILCLCGCFLAFLVFDSISLVWIVTSLWSFYTFLYLSLFIVCLHFYGLFTCLCSRCASLCGHFECLWFFFVTLW